MRAREKFGGRVRHATVCLPGGDLIGLQVPDMTVGVTRVRFRLHGNDSLKEKRRVVKSLVDKSRHRFNVSVAEVADQDVHQRTTIGISVVGSDGRVINSLLDRIIDFMDSLNLADLVDHEIELITL